MDELQKQIEDLKSKNMDLEERLKKYTRCDMKRIISIKS